MVYPVIKGSIVGQIVEIPFLLFGGRTLLWGAHRRIVVEFTPELRGQVRDNLAEMHGLYKRRYTPKVKLSKACNACSLKKLCLPKLMNRKKVTDYLAAAMEELK